ncbi:hypothetical protein ACYSNW_01440 [Enterococcus sp. LJL99]
MRNFKILRSMVLAFLGGLLFGKVQADTKLCITVGVLVLLFMTYDEVQFKNWRKAK